MRPQGKKQLPSPSSYVEQHFDAIFYFILAASGLLYAVFNPYYRTGVINDDAVFILGARSLWQGLKIHSYIMRPDYPLPGLPLLLAPFIKWVAPDWTRLEWIWVIMMVGLVYLLGRWGRRYLSAGETLAVVALVAFNPLIVKFSGIVTAEVPYTAVALLSFMLLSQLWETWNLKKALGLGFLLGWGCFVRPEGIVLLVGVLVMLVLTRKGRPMIPSLLAPVALWGVIFFFWWRRFQTTGTAYGGDLTALTTYWKSHFLSGLKFVQNSFDSTFLDTLTALTDTTSVAAWWIVGAAGLICIAGISLGVRALWEKQPKERPMLIGIGVFCGLYFLIHLFWHVVEPRYTIPLLPFLIVFLVRGFTVALPSLKHRKQWTLLMFAMLLIGYTYKNGYALYQVVESPNPLNEPPWRTLAWLRQNTPPDAMIMSGIAPSVELYADRTSMPGMTTGNAEMFLYQLYTQKVNYILDRDVSFLAQGVSGTEDPNKDWARFRFRLEHYPCRFHVIYQDPAEQTKIYYIKVKANFPKAYEDVQAAYRLYRAGQLDAAFQTAQASVALFPKMASAENLLGAIYWKRNDFKHAEQCFRESIEFMPTSSYAMLNLATLYHQTGHDDLAHVYIQQASDLSTARGSRGRFEARIKELYRLWAEKHGLIFLDTP